MVGIVFLHGRGKLRLRQGVILLGHADVPWDIFITRFRHQHATRQLRCAVLVWPDGYELELPGVGVPVRLKIICAIVLIPQATEVAPLLKRDAHHLSDHQIIVGIKRQSIVLDVIHRKILAVRTLADLAAHRAHSAGVARINIGKSSLLVVVLAAVTVGIDLNILSPVRKLQPPVSVALGIDVARAPHREQAGVELDITCRCRLYPGQTVGKPEGKRLAVLAPAHVNRGAVGPVFRSGLFGYLTQGLVAILAEIVYGDIFRPCHSAAFPFAATAAVKRTDNEGHMFRRWCRQREFSLLLPLEIFNNEHIAQQAFRAIQLYAVFPFHRRLLFRPITLRHAVAHTLEVNVIINLKPHIPVMRERHRQHIVALQLRRLAR